MEKENISKEIATELLKICPHIDKVNLNYETNFLEYGVSSIDFIQLLVFVENTHSIEIEDEFLIFDKLSNIHDIAIYVLSKLQT